MRYVLLIYGNEANYAMTTEEERNTEFQAYNAYTAEINQRGLFVAGEALQPSATATAVRVRDGKTIITDGPFAETKEQLAGYYTLNCKNLDEALELAAKIPGAKNGTIEVRPVIEM